MSHDSDKFTEARRRAITPSAELPSTARPDLDLVPESLFAIACELYGGNATWSDGGRINQPFGLHICGSPPITEHREAMASLLISRLNQFLTSCKESQIEVDDGISRILDSDQQQTKEIDFLEIVSLLWSGKADEAAEAASKLADVPIRSLVARIIQQRQANEATANYVTTKELAEYVMRQLGLHNYHERAIRDVLNDGGVKPHPEKRGKADQFAYEIAASAINDYIVEAKRKGKRDIICKVKFPVSFAEFIAAKSITKKK